jgi:uncharacterized DUF497 family protein
MIRGRGMIEFEGFEWDAANLAHATRHGVTREEIEGALAAGFVVARSYDRSGEARHSMVARSPLTGALLAVVGTVRGAGLRVITAHRLKRPKRKLYEQEI